MKKIYFLTAAVLAAAALLAFAGYAYAQAQTPTQPDYPNGARMMGGGFRGGMMGRWGNRGAGSVGPLHEYMLKAFAEKLGTTSDDLQAQLDAGETMWTVAETKGLTAEEFTAMMVDARSQALTQAVADGVITQEQADWMGERMQQMQANGFTPGNCPMHGGNPGRGNRGRWSNQ